MSRNFFFQVAAWALTLASHIANAQDTQVITPYSEGSQVEGTVTFQTKGFFSSNLLVELPLPRGMWRVVSIRPTKSTHSAPVDGIIIGMDLIDQKQVVGYLNFEVYGRNNSAWSSGVSCSRQLFKGAEQFGRADCYSGGEGDFFIRKNSSLQDKIRSNWLREGVEKHDRAFYLSGFSSNRNRAVVIFNLAVPIPSSVSSRNFEWFSRYAELINDINMGRTSNEQSVSANLQAHSIPKLQAALVSGDGLTVELAKSEATAVLPTSANQILSVVANKSEPSNTGDRNFASSLFNTENQRLLVEAETAKERQRQAEGTVARLQEQVRQQQQSAAQQQSQQQAQISAENQRLQAEAEAARERQRQAEETVARLQEQVRQQQSAAQQQSQQQAQSRRVALVVGNDRYKLIPKLETAGEDARAVAEYLQQLGYRVTLRQNLAEREMKATLRNFAAQVRGGDEVVLFFAGHGVQIGANNFLLPVDIAGESETQIRDDAIPLQRMLDDMNERKAGFTLAIVDACRDNPFKGTGRSIGGRGLASTTAASGQMVVFSAGAGQQALDRLGPTDKDRNGVFTRVFLRELKNRELSIDRVIRRVRTEVVDLAKSVGHEQVPAIYDQVVGDYYFYK